MAAYAKILPRRGTNAQWKTMNPIPLEGELCIECPDTGVGSGRINIKIGDGSTHYVDLPYGVIGATAESSLVDGGNASDEDHKIMLRGDTDSNYVSANVKYIDREILCILDDNGNLKDFKVGKNNTNYADLPLYSDIIINKITSGATPLVIYDVETDEHGQPVNYVLDFANDDEIAAE